MTAAEAPMNAPVPAAPPRSGFGPAFTGALIGLTLFMATLAGTFLVKTGPRSDPTVIVVIWLNITVLLGVLSVEVSRRPYSLHLMHLLALFLFLGAPSILQYTSGVFAVAGPITVFKSEIITAAFAVFLYISTYVLCYEVSHRFANVGERGPIGGFLSREVTVSRMNTVLGLSIIVLLYLALVMGLSGVTTRAAAREAAQQFTMSHGAMLGPGKAFYLINHLLLRAFPLVAVAGALLVLRRNGALRHPLLLALFVVTSIGVFFGNNPFAGSRIWLVTCMFGFSAPLVFARLRTGWAIVATAVGGLTVLPALAANRHATSFNQWLDWFKVVSPLDYLSKSTDVDSLGMLVLCVSYTIQQGHQWGLQIVSAVFSWFPRALWSSKGIGTGQLVTKSMDFEFTNLAVPVVGEAVVDFGLLGVPFLAGTLGLLFSRLDRLYWSKPHDAASPTRVIDIMLPFWLGLMVLLTRGDLIAAVAFILAWSFWVFPLGVGGAVATAARGPAPMPHGARPGLARASSPGT